MERSKRLIRYTLFTLIGIAVLHVAINRLYATNSPHAQRTPPAELATLHGFSDIEIDGDFGVDIVEGSGFAVTFTAPDSSPGNFVATVRGDTLVLRGFDNASANRVRVALPALKHLKTNGVTSVVIVRDSRRLSLHLDATPQVILSDNN